MRKRIVLLIICVLVIGQVVTLLSAAASFQYTYEAEMTAALKGDINAMELALDEDTDYVQAANNYKKAFGQDIRITFIAPDGTVLADTMAALATMDNHADREEVGEAEANEFGMAVRQSESTGIETLYVSKLLSNGDILRLAFPMENAYGFVEQAFPVMLIVLFVLIIVAAAFSGRIARGILAPMRQLHDSVQDYLNGEDTTFHIDSKYEETEEIALAFSTLAKRINHYIANIKKEQKKSALIMDNIQEGLMVLDKDQDVLLANAAALKIFNAKEFLDSVDIIYYTRDTTILHHIDDAFAKRQNTSFDYEDSQSGKTYRFYLSFVAENAFGKSGDGLLILITDKTATALADKVRYDFAANVSHELKTPLTSISGYAQLIENGMVKNESDVKNYARNITNESNRLMGLINDTLALSELENIRMDEEVQPLELAGEAQHVQSLLESKLHEKDMQMEIHGHAEMTANQSRIRQLLLNLCDNAIKYGYSGGKIAVALEEDADSVTITVQDNGIGIPEEEQNRVFERFYRAKNSGGATISGTGLGLAIVKHIVQLYAGEITLDSTLGKGCTFTIRMKKDR